MSALALDPAIEDVGDADVVVAAGGENLGEGAADGAEAEEADAKWAVLCGQMNLLRCDYFLLIFC